MIQAIQVKRLGGPEVLGKVTLPAPEPSEGEAVVAIRAAGVNFIDVYYRKGLYKTDLPFVPGVEGAGVVHAVGSNVTDVKVGDRVAFAMSLGSYAEQTRVAAWKLVPLPQGLEFSDGAAAMVQGLTAHYLTHGSYPIQAGETALVHAAAGGVGLLLVQMIKAKGASVIGTVSTEDKADLARQAGADEIILYTQADFEAEVKRLTGGRGVAVVYDSVGKDTFHKSLNCLRPRGYMVLFGQSSGPVEPIDPQILNSKGSIFLTRPSLAHYMLSRSELLKRCTDVFDAIQSGALKIKIGAEFPLEEAAQAHAALEGRKTTGKLILRIGKN